MKENYSEIYEKESLLSINESFESNLFLKYKLQKFKTLLASDSENRFLLKGVKNEEYILISNKFQFELLYEKIALIEEQKSIVQIIKDLSLQPFFLQLIESDIRDDNPQKIVIRELLFKSHPLVFNEEVKESNKKIHIKIYNIFKILKASSQMIAFFLEKGIFSNHPLISYLNYYSINDDLVLSNLNLCNEIKPSFIYWNPTFSNLDFLNPPELKEFLRNKLKKSGLIHSKMETYSWGKFAFHILSHSSLNIEKFYQYLKDETSLGQFEYKKNEEGYEEFFSSEIISLLNSCISDDPFSRPSMREVSKRLEHIDNSNSFSKEILNERLFCLSTVWVKFMNEVELKHIPQLEITSRIKEGEKMYYNFQNIKSIFNQDLKLISMEYKKKIHIKNIRKSLKQENSIKLEPSISVLNILINESQPIEELNKLHIRKRRKGKNLKKEFKKIEVKLKRKKFSLADKNFQCNYNVYSFQKITQNNFIHYIVEGVPMIIHIMDLEKEYIRLYYLYNNHSRIDGSLINSTLIICGGYYEEQYLNTTIGIDIQFNVENRNICYLSDMNKEKTNHTLITVHKLVYAIGGWIGNNLSICEQFDLEIDKWIVIPSLNQADSSLTISSIQDRFLYTFG